jgi:hypothetical protein
MFILLLLIIMLLIFLFMLLLLLMLIMLFMPQTQMFVYKKNLQFKNELIFFQKIYSNLEKLLDMCVKHGVPVLSIGIPDSGFLSHDKKARSRRDGVNSLLKEKAAELSRFVGCFFLSLVYLIIDAHRLKI